jgi:hypothetical protein
MSLLPALDLGDGLNLPENAPTLRAGSSMARSGSSVTFFPLLADVDIFTVSDIRSGRPYESSSEGGKSQSHLPSPFTSWTWLDLTIYVGLTAAPASNRAALTPDVDLDIFMSTFAPQTTHASALNQRSIQPQPTDRNQFSCLPTQA